MEMFLEVVGGMGVTGKYC